MKMFGPNRIPAGEVHLSLILRRSMSSEYFENREDDFRNLYEDINSKVQNLLPRAIGGETYV